MLKKIGTAARHADREDGGDQSFLELFVKVQPNWRESHEFVEELDWRRQLELLDPSRKESTAGSSAESSLATSSPRRTSSARSESIAGKKTSDSDVPDSRNVSISIRQADFKLQVTLAADRKAVDPVVQSIMEIVREIRNAPEEKKMRSSLRSPKH